MKYSKIIAFLFFAIYCQGQESEEVKKWVLGGNLSYFNSVLDQGDDDDDSERRFSWTPYLGYQLNNKWLIGVQMRFGWSESDREFLLLNSILRQNITSNIYGIGVFSRYHLATGEKWAIFIQPSYLTTLSSATYTTNGDESESDILSMNISASLGGYYNLSKNWRLTINMGNAYYENQREEFANGNEVFNQFSGIDMSLSNLRFGLEMLF